MDWKILSNILSIELWLALIVSDTHCLLDDVVKFVLMASVWHPHWIVEVIVKLVIDGSLTPIE